MNVRAGSVTGAFLAALALVACEGVVGGGSTEFEVLVAPDGSEEPGPAGSLDVVLSVSLEASDGFPVEISGGDRELALDLRQPAPMELGTASVMTGIYQGVTVRFREVEAEVAGDDPEGEGIPVRVDFGGAASLVADLVTQTAARDGDRFAVTVDLRAAEWLEQAEGPPEDRTVPAQAFLDAVRISVTPR